MDVQKYNRMRTERLYELTMKDSWTDADRLKVIMYSIEPYSRWWRHGMVRALRRAIKLLEEKE